MVDIRNIVYQFKQLMSLTGIKYLCMYPYKINGIGNNDYLYTIKLLNLDNFYLYPNNAGISDMYMRVYVYVNSNSKQDNSILLKVKLDLIVQTVNNKINFNKYLQSFTQTIVTELIVLGDYIDGLVDYYNLGYYEPVAIGSVQFKLIRCRNVDNYVEVIPLVKK